MDALCHPYHNELPRSLRNNVPKLTFEGENLDNHAQQALLRLIGLAKNPQELAERWGIVVISKSGGTLETAAAFRVFRDELERYYGPQSREATELVIPITGEVGRLQVAAASTTRRSGTQRVRWSRWSQALERCPGTLRRGIRWGSSRAGPRA